MQRRTLDHIAALEFLKRLACAAHTSREHKAVLQLHREISATHRAGGDVGMILARYGVKVAYQKYTGPDIPAQRSTNQPEPYHLDSLLRAIISSESNGH